jgi:hypothetical protein
MRIAGLIVVLAFSGCTSTSESRPYDCPQVDPTSSDLAQLQAAAVKAGISFVDLHSLSYCRQQGDGTLYAKWQVSRDPGNSDGTRQWDDVACANEAWSKTGWGCSTTRVRAVELTRPGSGNFLMVTLPAGMGAQEGRRISIQGLALSPSMTESNACGWNRDPGNSFRGFRETAAKEGIWNLEPQSPAGRFRLVRDVHYFDFNDSVSATPSAKEACWGVLEFLE